MFSSNIWHIRDSNGSKKSGLNARTDFIYSAKHAVFAGTGTIGLPCQDIIAETYSNIWNEFLVKSIIPYSKLYTHPPTFGRFSDTVRYRNRFWEDTYTV